MVSKGHKVPPLRIESTLVEINSPPDFAKTTLAQVAKKGIGKFDE